MDPVSNANLAVCRNVTTYAEIRVWTKKKYGLHVSNLAISWTKDRRGLAKAGPKNARAPKKLMPRNLRWRKRPRSARYLSGSV